MLATRALTRAVTGAHSSLVAMTRAVGEVGGRRSWSGAGRAWIEVRGLDGPLGDEVAGRVVEQVRAMPGVRHAELNRTLSRVVVWLEPDGPDVRTVSAVLGRCESASGKPVTSRAASSKSSRTDLPGDAGVLAGRMVAVGADALGLAAALAGRATRLPRVPGVAAAAVTFIDVQPRMRRAIEARLGTEAADVALALATAAAQTLTQGPASLALDLGLRATLLAESRASRRAWQRHEPGLAEHAACPDRFPVIERACPRPPGPIEKYADAAAAAGLVGAGVIGVATGSMRAAGNAVLVAAPKATRSAREAFSTTLSRHLSDEHDVLVLHSEALRRLDRVDALVIDPRALLTDQLAVGEVRGVEGAARTAVWTAARTDVENGLLGAGWHPLRSLSPTHDALAVSADAQILITSIPDPLASAIVSAARQAHVNVVSLDVEELGGLRAGFDDLQPCESLIRGSRGPDPAGLDTYGSAGVGLEVARLDSALTDAITVLQGAGRTVALLAVHAPQALAAADVALALTRPTAAPAWTADLLCPDLVGAWRVVSALPEARATSRRAVELSAGGSLLGALLMLPGVRGRGPGPVVAGAAVGLYSGRAAAMRVARLPVPDASPVNDFHALTVAETIKILNAPTGDPARRSATPPASASGGSIGNSVWRLGQSPLLRVRGLVEAARNELADPLTPILTTGAAASAVLGSPVDAALVGSVVLGNAVLSAGQRLRAERLLGRLLADQDAPARLVRTDSDVGIDTAVDPVYFDVTAREVQVGDLIEIRAGEVVPADARLITADGVEVDESSLTGESLPVSKAVEATPGAPLAERTCMVFEGTIVLTGTAQALVTAVGGATEAGRAGALAPPTSGEVGLQAQLGRLTARVLPVTVGGGLIVTALGLARGAGLRRAVSSGVSIAVAAVPEGLPLVATLAQQSAARRLTRYGVLVRSPRAIEALGRVDVVCFDKTGTLSENRLQVAAVAPMPGWEEADVLTCAARTCPQSLPGVVLQHATDTAVLEAFAAAAPARETELPFRPGRLYAAALYQQTLSVKGAPEALIDAAGAPASVTAEVHALAGRGLRVLAVARRSLTPVQAIAAASDDDALDRLCQDRLEIIGLIGLADTPRPDAAELLPTLIAGGRSVRVITGDHPLTAKAIVTALGLPIDDAQIMTGTDWARLSHRHQQEAVERVVVFARMSPEQKVQVVQALQAAGHVCAMVGDGANDAAAIRAASVGIGVASHGSDPARGAADVVLTNAQIGSLVQALAEGEQLWQRVQGALSVLLGGNAGEVAFTILATAVTGRAPLNARQLLLVNMLTDALPAAAVAVSTPRGSTAAGTRGLDEPDLWRSVALRGAATTAGATSAWTLAKLTGRSRRASTVGLIALVSTQLGQTLLDSRSPLVVVTAAGSLTVLAGLISTPGVSQLLGCTPIGPIGWTQALTCATGATILAGLAPHVISTLASPEAEAPSTVSRSFVQHQGEVTPNRTTEPVA
ncbi:MAG: cation-translocating P-type ATPase [Actinomycetota bacterium]|nr:cation-translocating P-type ATPase [Actinomycetota bacterium]